MRTSSLSCSNGSSAVKPSEFGRLVQVDEVENGVVSNYDVKHGNPADTTAWTPAISRHEAIFGRAPKVATADRGFFFAENESAARKAGVDHVAVPARGPLSDKRKKHQKQRPMSSCLLAIAFFLIVAIASIDHRSCFRALRSPIACSQQRQR